MVDEIIATIERLASYAEITQTKIFIFILFISIVFILEQLLDVIWSKIPTYKKLSRPNPKINIKEFNTAIIGAVSGFLIMSNYPKWAIIAAICGAWVGYGAKKFGRWIAGRLSEEKRINEILLLYQTIGLYARAGYSLLEALNASLCFTNLTYTPLKKCINNWGHGPEQALDKLRQDLHCPEGDALIGILKRAIVIGPNKLVDFLLQENKTLVEMRQFKMEQGLGIRPLIQTLYLLFPGLALIGVTLMPVGYYISKVITSIRAT